MLIQVAIPFVLVMTQVFLLGDGLLLADPTVE